MKPRAYTDVDVSTILYCSSDSHHHVHVWFKRRGKRGVNAHISATYCVEFGWLDNLHPQGNEDLRVPAYLRREIKRQLLAHLEAGTVKVHEYDRDGNKRWENLRYHEDDWVATTITWLRSQLGEVQS